MPSGQKSLTTYFKIKPIVEESDNNLAKKKLIKFCVICYRTKKFVGNSPF